MSQIGEKIKHLRNSLKLTQEDFAFKIGVSRSGLAQVEAGNNNPTFEAVGAICSQFNIDANYLYDNSISTTELTLSNNNFLHNKQHNEIDKVNDKVTDKVNSKKEVQKEFLKQNGASAAELELVERDMYEGYPHKSEAGKLMGDIENRYYVKVRKELAKEDGDLAGLLQLVDHTDVLISDIYSAFYEYIFTTPSLFDNINFAEFKSLADKSKISDKVINYKDYKQNMIQWLERIKTYQAAIQEFYTHGEQFLNKIEPAE